TLASGTDQDRWDHAQVVVQAIGSPDRKTIVRGGADARYLRSGHLVYAVAGVLFVEPFDIRKMASSGEPIPVVDGVARAAAQTGSGWFAVSDTGTLAYVPGPAISGQAGSEVALLDLKGNVKRLKLQQHAYQTPRFSPNGQQLAFGLSDGRT